MKLMFAAMANSSKNARAAGVVCSANVDLVKMVKWLKDRRSVSGGTSWDVASLGSSGPSCDRRMPKAFSAR